MSKIPSLRKQYLGDIMEVIRKKQQDMELEMLRALQESRGNKDGVNHEK